MSEARYYIGDWKVEPALRRISKANQSIKLEPQLMDVLQLLASEPGKVVSKDELRQTVWSEVVITENVITRSISSLRKLLDDDPISPTYIETISKKGYRLIADVKRDSVNEDGETFVIKLAAKPFIIAVALIIVAVLGAFAIRQVFLPSTASNAFLPKAVSNTVTTEYWPALSPDGRFVAYGWKGNTDSNWDIYAKLIGTETVLRLTNHPASELRPKWSSDGNYVYYLRYEDGGSTIYKKPITGGRETRIMTSPQFSFGDFDISPDSKWVSFNTRTSRDTPLKIVRISLETGEIFEISSPPAGFNGDIHPRFSPDGSKLAFIRENNPVNMHLYVYDIEAETIEKVSSDALSINGFDWSRDGSSIVYSSDKAGVYRLYELNPKTNESFILKSGDYQMVMPRVASNGRIVYAKMRDNVNIWSFDRDNQVANMWYATNELNLNPSVSSDGTRVCFTKQKNDRFEIWTAFVDGTNAIPVTEFQGSYLTNPRWSVDSRNIYFQGFIDGQVDLFVVDANGGVAENLTRSDHDEHMPFAVVDKVFFSSNKDGDWNIWQMNKNGGEEKKVMPNEGYAPQLTSDASRLFYVKRSEPGIWEFDMLEKKEKRIISDFLPMYNGAFVVTDQGIFYFSPSNKRFEYLNFETQKLEIIYQPQRRIPRLGITLSLFPGQRRLLFSQVDENDADIMLLEQESN